jgi:hypothetical protein
LAAIVFSTWLLTLATSIRHRAWVVLLARDMGTTATDAGKVIAVVLGLLLVYGGTLIVIRTITGSLSRRAFIGAAVVAVVVVAANFFLLYTYVGALINPRVSAGIVLVLTLLLWVNIVVRAYLATLCWISAPRTT